VSFISRICLNIIPISTEWGTHRSAVYKSDSESITEH